MPLPFQASRNCLHSCLMAFFIFKASSVAPSSMSLFPSLYCLLFVSDPSISHLQQPVGYTGPIQTIHYNLSISRFSITLAKSLLPCKVMQSHVLGDKDMDIFVGPLLSLPQQKINTGTNKMTVSIQNMHGEDTETCCSKTPLKT